MAKTKVKQRVDALIAKRKEIEAIKNPVWKTSCLYKPSVLSDRGGFDIRQASMSQLVAGFKNLLSHEEACKALSTDEKLYGYSVEDWKADMKLRSAQLRRTQILNDIQKYTAALRPLLTKAELRDLKMEEEEDNIDAILEIKL